MQRYLCTLYFAIVAALPQAAGVGMNQYFAWESAGADAFSSQAGGVSATLAFSTSGDDHIFRNDRPGTAPDFVAKYGSLVEAIKFDSGAAGTAGAATAQVRFSSPLPIGARLLAFDLDVGARDERFQITRPVGALALIEQLESVAGASSLFPAWTAATGVLMAQGNRTNDEEVTAFDISGVQALTVRFFRNAGGTGVNGASFAIGLPVPEPAAIPLTIAALLCVGLMLWPSRRQVRTSSGGKPSDAFTREIAPSRNRRPFQPRQARRPLGTRVRLGST